MEQWYSNEVGFCYNHSAAHSILSGFIYFLSVHWVFFLALLVIFFYHENGDLHYCLIRPYNIYGLT